MTLWTTLYRLPKQWIRGQKNSHALKELKVEENQRRTHMLRVLLVGIESVTLFATFYLVYTTITHPSPSTQAPLWVMLVMNGLWIGFFLLAKRTNTPILRYIFVILEFLVAVFISMVYGANLPEGLLMYGLVITFAGILLDTRAAISFVILNVVALCSIFLLQDNGILHVGYSWKDVETTFADMMVYGATLGIIGTVTWLSNREIEHSELLKNQYADELKHERDSLEEKVTERTQDLQTANKTLHKAHLEFQRIQKEKFIEINNLAALGRITSGLMHDIVEPLTYASTTLELEQMREKGSLKRAKGTPRDHSLRVIFDGLREITTLIESTRKQIQHRSTTVAFTPKDEIMNVCRFLRYALYKKRLRYVFKLLPSITLEGDPAKFHQCMTNLLSNAIEAYAKQHVYKKREIRITMKIRNRMLEISVQDFGDGIPQKDQKHIFKPFFTTKDIKEGTGIGLTAIQDIMAQFFHGTITFTSQEGKGSTFTLHLPYETHRKHGLINHTSRSSSKN